MSDGEPWRPRAAGVALGYGVARAISRQLRAARGMQMPVEFHAGDVRLLLGLLAAAGLCALIPAAIAYRRSPKTALRA
ncbi:hypothetical protein [Amaricoccus sp.]|uniref:hypothetical protein n=1 Tax=Amaricoccus sp. TaxID=1872485 RepID=UPI001B3DD820|nr:hypothetical protein [Amaricoccus sp.]MBP7240957.1 hypothetical protein [Amaricoccus sp.]